jgi:hypothetical protein
VMMIQYTGSTDDSFGKVNQETEQKLVEITEAYKKNKDLVIDKLLASIVNVDPKVLHFFFWTYTIELYLMKEACLLYSNFPQLNSLLDSHQRQGSCINPSAPSSA